ncbi:MAG: glycoside hydrolase family 32 protein [Planctomycetia bacterium]|nr:glycoside hydrolase family 32 protein [Planctomycetia bacterium]
MMKLIKLIKLVKVVLFLVVCVVYVALFTASTEAASTEKTVKIQEKYLILPICNSASKKVVEITDENGIRAYKFEVTLADTSKKADWNSFLDMSQYTGQSMKITLHSPSETVTGEDSAQLALIVNVSEVPRNEPLYQEKYRPQFHFSQMQGWNNDPNGMVFWNGEYHLFWQSNPMGLPWGNMFWGHAVTRDLVHWTELPLALRPFGDDLPPEKRDPSMAVRNCFSGTTSPAWDVEMSPENEANRPLLAAFTDTGVGEALAISTDQGRTWKYDSVLVRHHGRDPQLIWFPEEKTWVMPVYDEKDGRRQIAFYQSKDRKNWERTGEIDGFFECPNMYELPVDGDPNNTRWVLWAADAQYVIGKFDGKTFIPEHEGKHRLHYGQFYASLCFNNTPGRLIQIGWAQIGIPFEARQPFNQTFTLPLDLTLRTTPDGIRLFAKPVPEMNVLRGEKREFTEKLVLSNNGDADGNGSGNSFGDGQLYELCVTLDADKDAELVFGRNSIRWNAAEKKLDEMVIRPKDGKIMFCVWIDRPMYEICANNGEAYKTYSRHDGGEKIPAIELRGDGAETGKVTVWALKGIHNR